MLKATREWFEDVNLKLMENGRYNYAILMSMAVVTSNGCCYITSHVTTSYFTNLYNAILVFAMLCTQVFAFILSFEVNEALKYVPKRSVDKAEDLELQQLQDLERVTLKSFFIVMVIVMVLYSLTCVIMISRMEVSDAIVAFICYFGSCVASSMTGYFSSIMMNEQKKEK